MRAQPLPKIIEIVNGKEGLVTYGNIPVIQFRIPDCQWNCWSAQYPKNSRACLLWASEINWAQSLSIPWLRDQAQEVVSRGTTQEELCCYAKEQRADLSQQFASFCSLLKLSSYKRHKWYLYPPTMSQVLGLPIVALCHFSLAKYILCWVGDLLYL